MTRRTFISSAMAAQASSEMRPKGSHSPQPLGWGSGRLMLRGTILMVSLSSPFQAIPLNKHGVLLRISPLAMMFLLIGKE